MVFACNRACCVVVVVCLFVVVVVVFGGGALLGMVYVDSVNERVLYYFTIYDEWDKNIS